MKLLKEYRCPKERATVHMSVVLRHKPNAHMPFVTHIYDHDNEGHFWGHYFDDLDKAETDFAARCVKYPGGRIVVNEPLDS